MSKISLVYLTDTLNAGGTERQLTELALRLDRSQFCPRVFSYAHGDFFRKQLELNNVQVHQAIRKHKFDLYPILELAEWLKKGEIDLIHAFGDTANIYAVLAKKIAKRGKVVASIRNASDMGRSHFYWLIKNWTYRNADFTISNNEAGLQRVANQANLLPSKLTCLHNGIDVTEFYPPSPQEREASRQSLGLLPKDFVFLSVGTFYRLKNYSGYLKAISEVHLPSHYKFIWIGRARDQKLLSYLRQEIEVLKLQENFRIISDPTTDVVSFYHAADILVLNSLSEGTPNVIIEAMACKLPVISTKVGDVSKLVVENKTGWLIPPNDAKYLARVLSIAANCTDEQREQMGKAGRQRLLDLRLDIDSVVKFHEHLYRDILSS